MKKPRKEDSVALVLGLSPKKEEAEEQEAESSMESEYDSKEAAARVVYDSIKEGDFDAFKSALSSYVYLCTDR